MSVHQYYNIFFNLSKDRIIDEWVAAKHPNILGTMILKGYYDISSEMLRLAEFDEVEVMKLIFKHTNFTPEERLLAVNKLIEIWPGTHDKYFLSSYILAFQPYIRGLIRNDTNRSLDTFFKPLHTHKKNFTSEEITYINSDDFLDNFSGTYRSIISNHVKTLR